MKINLSKTITRLDGELIADKSAGYILAHYMMAMSSPNPTKLFHLASEMIEDKEMEVSEDDYQMLVDIATKGSMDNITKAKILIELKGE